MGVVERTKGNKARLCIDLYILLLNGNFRTVQNEGNKVGMVA